MARGKIKADHRADNRGGAWAGLPHCVIDSAAYRHLSLWGRAVLVEIVRQMNGYNNGEIGISQRQIAERLNTTNFRQITRALAQLMEHGLIEVETEGKWKQRLAREYRLTFVNTGAPGRYKSATNEYRSWTPTRLSGADTVSAETPNPADTVSAKSPIAADTVSARFYGKLPKTSSSSADTVSSLICKPYPGTETTDQNTPSEKPLNTAGDFSATHSDRSAA